MKVAANQDENTKDSRKREDMQNAEETEMEISIRNGEGIHQPKDVFGLRKRRHIQNAKK
jgi:hypothetical protein